MTNDGAVEIPDGACLANIGTITNAGTFTIDANNGKGGGELYTCDTLTNDGILCVAPDAGSGGGTLCSYGTTFNYGTLSGNIDEGGVLNLDNASVLVYSGGISGRGKVVVNGTGSITLTGDNTYSGGTTIDSGLLEFEGSQSLPSTGSVLINSGGALAATGPYATATQWLATGRIETDSTGALALTSDEASINLAGYEELSLGASSSVAFSGTISPCDNTFRLGGGPGTLTVSSDLSDENGSACSLVVSGSVTLTAANTYRGGTIIASGTLDVEGSIIGPVSTTGGELVGTNAPSVPTMTVDTTTTSAPVDQSVTETGDWSVPGTDSWQLSASVGGSQIGTVTDTGGGTWSWSWTPPAGTLPGSQTVTVTATDESTGYFASQTFEVDLLSATATSVTIVSPSAVAIGSPLTLYATVSAVDPNVTATPTGSVEFSDGATDLGTATLDSSGTASLLVPGGLSAGSNGITATYIGSGSESLDPSTATRQITASIAPTKETATAFPSTVTGTTTNLSVADGASDLIYCWAATTEPAGAADPTFSINDSSAAYATTATFSQAGTYVFTATIANPQGLAATSTVTVTVSQTPTTIAVSPSPLSLPELGSQTMIAVEEDQFGNALSTQPTFAWSAEGGTIDASTGVYAAPGSAGSALITATDATHTLSGSETVNIVPALLDDVGSATVNAEMPYTLYLPEPNGPVAGWTIDWGDGNYSTTNDNPPSLTHVYTSTGIHMISAADSGGTTQVSTDGGQAGTIDPNFNINSGTSGSAGFQSMAVQPDGQIVVCGQSTGSSALVARYNTNGSSDSTTNFQTSGLDVAQAVAIDPVGNQSEIVVVGQVTATQFGMVRYLCNGVLDSTFDTNFNAAASPFPGESFTPEQVAVQPGGRIVVAGYVVSDSGTDLGVARYNADGTLDATFGTGGGATAGLNVATQDPCGAGDRQRRQYCPRRHHRHAADRWQRPVFLRRGSLHQRRHAGHHFQRQRRGHGRLGRPDELRHQRGDRLRRRHRRGRIRRKR